MVTWGEKDGVTDLTFLVGDVKWQLIRHLVRPIAILKNLNTKEEVRGVKKVNKALMSMFDVKLQNLKDILFVAQEKLDNPLKGRESARRESFGKLFECDVLEKIRTEIKDAVSKLASMGSLVDVADVENKYKETTTVSENIKREKEELRDLKSEIKEAASTVDELNLIITSRTDEEVASKILILQETFSKAQRYLQDTFNIPLDEAIQKCINHVNNMYDSKLNIYNTYLLKHTQLNEISTALENEEDMLTNELNSYFLEEEELLEIQNRESKLKYTIQLVQLGKCTICGTEYAGGETIEDLQKEMSNIQDMLEKHNQYNHCLGEYTKWYNAKEQLTLDLNNLKVDLLTEEEYLVLSKESLVVKANRNKCLQIVKQFETYKTNLTKLENIPTVTVSEKEIATEARQQLHVLLSKQSSLDISIQVAEQLYLQQKKDYNIMHEQYIKQEQTAQLIEELTNIRDTIHRDMLQKEIRKAGAGIINNLLTEFISLFNIPYNVFFNNNGDLKFTEPKKTDEHPFTDLSVGQRKMTALAYRLALMKLFADNIMFFVLDEPTAYVDKKNITAMRDSFSNLNIFAKQKGMTILIATHEEELLSIFNDLIKF